MSQYYDLASMAEASYVLFSKLDNFKDTAIEGALKTKNINGEFSATQAADFVSKWSVKAHTPNTDNGYSSTVFKSKTGSEYVLAFRGTEGLFSDDLAITDLGDIVGDGLAIKQIVDMHNDIHRMRAAAGATYSMAALELNVLETDRLSIAARNPVLYKQVKAELLARTDLIFDGMAVYNVVLSDVTATEDGALKDAASITVTGHSLGGHLASAASRLFPGLVQDALTINGAGFSPATEGFKHANVRNLFALLGGASQFDASKIQNLYGERGFEVVTQDSPYGFLAQPGKHEGIIIEALFGHALGHGKGQMTDALAVYDLFITADSRLQTASAETVMAALNPIFEGASNNTDATFETLLNALGKLFVKNYAPIVGTNALREDLYAGVTQIIEKLISGSLQVESLVGKTSGELATQAQTDIAARYALVHLNPFIITGNDALYAQHNTNGELDLVNPSTGQGLSEQYLKARAKFLALKNELAVADRPWQATIPSDMHGYYEDRGSQFAINNTYNATRVPAVEYIFGSDGPDVIESFRDPRVPHISFNDHLFGGAGNDIIRGHAGDDYLEGGPGQDSMDGGKDNDTFYIQGTDTDYDIFRGGPGTDTILGSNGDDTIRVHKFTGEDTVEVIDGGEGFDVIAGTDGADIIDLTGTSLISIERIEGGKGNDTILGSMGNDTIHGGEDDDVITGNKGDDLLVGGSGRDVYVYAEGDGHDTIIDSGDNLIQLRLADGSIVPVGDFLQQDASTWESVDGLMRLVHNTTWKILMPGGGSIDLGAGFTEGDYGIRLITPSSMSLTLTGTANRDEMGLITPGSNPADWELVFRSGSLVLHQQQLPFTAPRMHITGGASGDFLFGFQSRDEIYGGDGYLQIHTRFSMDKLHQFGVTVTPPASTLRSVCVLVINSALTSVFWSKISWPNFPVWICVSVS